MEASESTRAASELTSTGTMLELRRQVEKTLPVQVVLLQQPRVGRLLVVYEVWPGYHVVPWQVARSLYGVTPVGILIRPVPLVAFMRTLQLLIWVSGLALLGCCALLLHWWWML